MKDYSCGVAPSVKGDKFCYDQCSRNDLEWEQMKNIPYASTEGSLMFAKVCTGPDLAFAIGMLGRFRHWSLEGCKEGDEISTSHQRLHAYIQMIGPSRSYQVFKFGLCMMP